MKNTLAIVLLVLATASVAFGVVVHQRQEARRVHGAAVAANLDDRLTMDTLAIEHYEWLVGDAGWTASDVMTLDEWIRRLRRDPDSIAGGPDALESSLERLADLFREGRPDEAREAFDGFGG